MRIVKLTAESKKGLLEDLLQRSPNHYGQYESAVAEIIETVKKGGDEALFSYTEKFDHCKMDAAHIRVTREEIDEAYQKVDADFVAQSVFPQGRTCFHDIDNDIGQSHNGTQFNRTV